MNEAPLRELVAQSMASPYPFMKVWPVMNNADRTLSIEGAGEGCHRLWSRQFTLDQLIEALCLYEEREAGSAIQLELDFQEGV